MFINKSRFYVSLSLISFIKASIHNLFYKNRIKINKEIEKKLFIKFNIKYFYLFNYGRNAFGLTLNYIKTLYPHKKKILINNYTLPAMIEKIKELNLVPILVDLKNENLNFDFEKIKNIIDDNTLAVVLTNLTGKHENFISIYKYLEKLKIAIIEDNAINLNKIDVNFNYKYYFRIYSFHFTKIIGSIRGGMLVLSNENIYENLKKIYSDLSIDKNIFLNKNFYLAILIKIATNKILYQIIISKFLIYLKNKDINTINFFLRSSQTIKIKEPKLPIKKIGNFEISLLNDNLNNFENIYFHKKTINKLYYELLKNNKNVKVFKELNQDYFHEFPVIFLNPKNKLNFILKTRSKNLDIRENYYFPFSKSKELFYSNDINKKMITLPNHLNIDEDYAKELSQIVMSI